jgi:N-methylhydantoinase A
MARLAVDIGGTFTDVALEAGDGGLTTAKVPTTPGAPELGVMQGVTLALDEAGLAPGAIAHVIHGTTLATNALIERKGAVTALIVTEGFRDTLAIAYESRYDQYDVFLEKAPPVVPRYLTLPVAERMDVRGQVLTPLDESAVDGLIETLDRHAVEAVAIGFLHAYANPAHEKRVEALLRARRPDLYITLSSDVCPEMREYERLSTAACNAYVQPLMARYLRALQASLAAAGIAAPLLLMTSGGGLCALETAVRFPIRLVESGPSGGAILSATVAAQRGERRVMSYDMGGTTAKICLIDDFTPQTARTFEIARAARFMKGSGMPIRIPVIEMIEIGAGGGSIARVDNLERITVGPDSAGSEPGPACYGRGGTGATVTDGDLLLGRLDAAGFADGRMQLDTAAAQGAMAHDVAGPLKLDTTVAAHGLCEVVDESMANAARVHAVERGKDLRERTMIAFGGAGPLHAARLAEKLDIARIVVPLSPGVGSAVGFLWAPVAYEVVKSHYMTLDGFAPDQVTALYDDLAAEARAVVGQAAGDAQLTERRTCFMRYLGQGHEIEVELPSRPLDTGDRDRIRAAYDEVYAKVYGRTVPDMDIEILSWTLVVQAPARRPDGAATEARDHAPAANGTRPLFDGAAGGFVEAPVYDRRALEPGACFKGPCVIVEGQTTTVVSSRFAGRIDGHRHIVLDLIGAAAT